MVAFFKVPHKSPIDQLTEGFTNDVKQGNWSIIFGSTEIFSRFPYKNHDTLLKFQRVVTRSHTIVEQLRDHYNKGLWEVVSMNSSDGVCSWCFIFEQFKYVRHFYWSEL